MLCILGKAAGLVRVWDVLITNQRTDKPSHIYSHDTLFDSFMCHNHIVSQLRSAYQTSTFFFDRMFCLWSFIYETFYFCLHRSPRYYSDAFACDRFADIRKKWDKIPTDTDILMTHCPPYGKTVCCLFVLTRLLFICCFFCFRFLLYVVSHFRWHLKL